MNYQQKYLKYKIKYSNLKSQIGKGQTLDKFLISSDNVIIGSGGNGTIYINASIPNFVIKKSNKSTICRDWVNEKTLIDNFNNKLYCFNYDSTYVEFSKVHDSLFSNTECYIVLQRVYHPSATTQNNNDKTIQVQLGSDDIDYSDDKRGHFLGIKQLLDFVSRDKLIILTYQLGKAISSLHYVGKNDGYDVEVFLGKPSLEETELKFFIMDFDLSHDIVDYNDSTIYNMYWCLQAVPYFPVKDLTDIDFYTEFKKGYFEIATLNGMTEIAEKVFEYYDE